MSRRLNPQVDSQLKKPEINNQIQNGLEAEAFCHAPPHILKTNFKHPPEQVKPWVYWYWVSNNISKTGIEKDLAAMQKAGIHTALIGIIHLSGKEGDVKALTDPWWDYIRFAIKKAAEYNIDIGLFNSPGWSQSGGPWVTYDKSMRYLDSNEYQFSGAQQLNMTLNGPENDKHEFFQSVRVLAFKTPNFEQERLTPSNSQITITNPITHTVLASNASDASASHLEKLFDGDTKTAYHLPQEVLNHQHKGARSKGQLHIDIKTSASFQARSLEIYPHETLQTQATLLAKNKAGKFEVIKVFDVQRPRTKAAIGPDHDALIVVSFPAVDAKHYRIVFNGFNRWRKDKPTDPVGFKDIILSKAYKLERYVEKNWLRYFLILCRSLILTNGQCQHPKMPLTCWLPLMM